MPDHINHNDPRKAAPPQHMYQYQSRLFCHPYLKSPQQIQAMLPGKSKLSALHDIVHAFRLNFGWSDLRKSPNDDSQYREAVETYAKLQVDPSDAAIIEALSSPQGYASIRQCGRMRASRAFLDEKSLTELSVQIRAALNWFVSTRNNPLDGA